MIRSTRNHKVSVCVLAAHPLVLAQVERILNTTSPSNAGRLSVINGGQQNMPRASVYVLDAASCANGAVAEVRQLLSSDPEAQVLVLGDGFNDEQAFEFLHAGAKGLLTHEKMEEQLPKALSTISSGGFWVWRRMLSRFVLALSGSSRRAAETLVPGDVRLSQRERQIASALCKNLTNKEIANELNISERTVKFHVSNLLSKFNVQRRSDLVMLWYGQAGNGLNPRFTN
jgi:DNA-binding NarL/FixJ family response regulator